MIAWIRESNLIEGVDSDIEDQRSERAWTWFKGVSLTLPSIRALHNRLMALRLPSIDRGHWRTVQVWVGGREGSQWESIHALMLEWLAYALMGPLEGDTPEIWIKRCHVMFETIHPFIDGNGRVGRMILNWQRIHWGLPELCIKASERQAYYEWFK